MTTVKSRTAEALAPVLSMFHSIGDRSLCAVWQVYTEGSLDKLIFDFGQISLIVAADENDDSIDIAVAGQNRPLPVGCADGSQLQPWTNIIGKPFGWGWVTVNQQGYCDGLLLGFGEIIPQIVLNVIASTIKVGVILSA